MFEIYLNPCPCCGKQVHIKDGDDYCEIGCHRKDCTDNPRVRAVNADLCVTMWNSLPNSFLNNKTEFLEVFVGRCDWMQRCTKCERYTYCSWPNKRVMEDKNA